MTLGGIACSTLNSLTFTRPGVEFVGQPFSFKCWSEVYQAFEKPLPRGLITTRHWARIPVPL